MNLDRVIDIKDMDLVKNNIYDLAIFSCGYESRCCFIPKHLNKKNFNKVVVLGFKENASSNKRKSNNDYYLKNWVTEISQLSASDEGPIYEILNGVMFNKKEIKILVDYSSMSRLWYAGIFNWVKFQENFNSVVIDFVYSVGSYKKDLEPKLIRDILAIPGFEGGPISFAKSVSIFGLGFDGLASMCIVDRLEPDEVYSFIASPSIFKEYPKRALKANKTFLDYYSKKTFRFPLLSIENTFRYLCELISTYRDNSDISLIPMGPKPHILASILVSYRFREITCLHVSANRPEEENIKPSGDFALTSVSFTSNN